MKGFVEFMRKEMVFAVAAGFIIGSATIKLLENFVVGIVDPLVASLFNTTAYVNKTAVIGEGSDAVVVNWGPSVVLLVVLVVAVLVVYGLGRWFGFIKGGKKKK